MQENNNKKMMLDVLYCFGDISYIVDPINMIQVVVERDQN